MKAQNSQLPRMDNMDEVFKISPNVSIANTSILLVDDVMTTGATLCMCQCILGEWSKKCRFGDHCNRRLIMTDIDLLKYPIGKFIKPETISQQNLKEASAYLRAFPQYLEETIKEFTEEQLNTPYRPGGWTVKELIHHLSDSHMNALMRFKLALTENNPTIKPYDETAWSKLIDYSLPVSDSVPLIRGIHAKWAINLDSMSVEDFDRTYFHPQSQTSVPLSEVTLMYQWHSMHHLAHIQHLIIRENW